MRCGRRACDRRSPPATRSPSTVSIRFRDCPTASATPKPRRSCRTLFRKIASAAAGRQLARLDHPAVFRFFPDAADGATAPGLWLDADVLLLKPVEIDPTKPYFAWERPRQLGNSVLYLPPGDPIVAAFEYLMRQDELTPDWLALRHRLTFALRRLRGGSKPALRYSRRDLRAGGADRARPPHRRTALRAAEEVVLCGSRRTQSCSSSPRIFQR